MIHVSFPRPPDAYPADLGWHAQISNQVFGGLKRRFGAGRVAFVPWNQAVETPGRDLLVTFLPNANYAGGRRIVGIENDTLIPERWRVPVFGRHGIAGRVDDIAHLFPLLENAVGLAMLTNDVALDKLRRGDAATVAHVAELAAFCGGNLHVGPHPIDKGFAAGHRKGPLNRPDSRWGHRMMVYHAGWRKNSAEAIALLDAAGVERGRAYDIVARIDKNDPAQMRAVSRRFNIVFSGSFSETGPINLLEYLLQGLVVAGHEDWWPGYGLPQSVWSYDPARREEMTRHLLWLLDPANLDELEGHRDRILADYLARRDNEWETFNDRLAEIVRAAM